MCELLHTRALVSSIVTLLLHLAVTCVTAFFLSFLYDRRSNDIDLAPRGRRHVRNSFWDSGAANGHERFGCGSPIEHNDLPARLGDCLRSCRTIRGPGSAGFIAALMPVIAAPSGFPMGEPTLDRRFHRKLETEGLTLQKVLLLVALPLGVACAVGVVDQLQRFGAQSDNSPPAFFLGPQMAQARLMAYHHLARVAPKRNHDVAPTLPEERYGLKRADKRRSPEMATSRGSSIRSMAGRNHRAAVRPT